MSRLSETKANSTRLPPRSKVAPAKKRLGKQSKAGRRKMVERENAERERLNKDIEESCTKLIGVLASGGVSEQEIERLRKGLTLKEEEISANDEQVRPPFENMITSLVKADSAVDRSWSFVSCYPSINVKDLITVLDQLRALLCESAELNRKPVHRKLEDVSADPKVDPDALEVAIKNDEQCADVVTKCLVGAYKTRALRLVANAEAKESA